MPEPLQPLALTTGVVVCPSFWVDRGRIEDRLSHHLIDDVLAAFPSQRGLFPPNERWTGFLAATLTVGANGWRLHDTLRDANTASRQLLARLGRVGDAIGRLELPGTDLMHIDVHHQNLLDRDRLEAVIDWGGAMPGRGLRPRYTGLLRPAHNLRCRGGGTPVVRRREDGDTRCLGALRGAPVSAAASTGQSASVPKTAAYWIEASNKILDRHA